VEFQVESTFMQENLLFCFCCFACCSVFAFFCFCLLFVLLYLKDSCENQRENSMWKFGNKRGIQVEINIHAQEKLLFCFVCCLFAACCLCFMCFVLLCLKNSCGNQLNNVEFKMESKEELKRSKEYKVEFQSENQKNSNKLKHKTRTWDVWSKKCPKF
jgi:hypothetical protein